MSRPTHVKYESKFNYNVIFASSHMFHFVLFWYNQLNPQAQFTEINKKNNDVLTSKECIFMQYLVLGLRLDFSFGGLIYRYASNFIHN